MFRCSTIAHKLDACRLQHGGSMPRAAAKIVAMAKNAPAKKVVLIEGGVGGTGNPCTSGYHMYDGAKSKVVDAVAIFVLQNTNTTRSKVTRIGAYRKSRYSEHVSMSGLGH